ncbi:MAG: hypothetical protein V4735_00740 [Pseudomonadota bacterium]
MDSTQFQKMMKDAYTAHGKMDYAGSIRIAGEIFDAAKSAPDTAASLNFQSQARYQQSFSSFHAGKMDDALGYAEQARALAAGAVALPEATRVAGAQHPGLSLSKAHGMLGESHTALGDFASGEEHFYDARKAGMSVKEPAANAYVQALDSSMVRFYVASAQPGKADELSSMVRSAREAAKDPRLATSYLNHGEVALALGMTSQATEYARKALDTRLADNQQKPDVPFWTPAKLAEPHLLLAAIHIAENRLGDAEKEAGKAKELLGTAQPNKALAKTEEVLGVLTKLGAAQGPISKREAAQYLISGNAAYVTDEATQKVLGVTPPKVAARFSEKSYLDLAYEAPFEALSSARTPVALRGLDGPRASGWAK